MIDCIVNVGFSGWYPKGSNRLYKSLQYHGYAGELAFWMGDQKYSLGNWPPEAPTFEDCPYGMKLYAFFWAMEQGHQSIMWLDSSAWAVKYPVVHEQAIGRDGYYIVANGDWRSDQWTNDACLAHFGVTREEARGIPLISGGIIGLDFRNPIAYEFFKRYAQAMNAGVFKGEWTNPEWKEGGEVRYRGHRHDQACASIIAYQMGLYLHPEQTYDYYYQPVMPETVEFALAGM